MERADEMIEAYRVDALANGFRPATLAGRAREQREFFRFCAEQGVERITAVTLEVLEGYQRYLGERTSFRGRPLALRTQINMVQRLAGFLRFLTRTGWLLVDPSLALEHARPCDTLPEILTRREVRRLLAAPDPSTALGLRDRAILVCFYATGMRLAELVHLRLEDVDFEGRTIAIRGGKGGRDRVVPMGSALRRALLAYLAEARDRLIERPTSQRAADDRGALFVSWLGRGMGTPTVQDVVENHARAAGLVKAVHPHLLRHAFATHMVEAGADVRLVQAILGHRSLSSTERYTRMSLANLKKVHRKSHPREKEAAGS